MKRLFYLFGIMLGALSCASRQSNNNLDYMKNAEVVIQDLVLKNAKRTLQSGDQLIITVTAKDNDVVRPFNQNYSSTEALAQQAGAGNIAINSSVSSGPMYIVDSEGNINFPVIGTIKVENKTVEELQKELTQEIREYVLNPVVNVRHTNFKISVIGEVARPGDYFVPSGRANLLNAVSLAGDLTQYGRRDNVTVIRMENGSVSRATIDLQDANFVSSPYYELKQGDIVYVAPNKMKNIAAKTNPNIGIYIQIASVALTALALTINLLQ